MHDQKHIQETTLFRSKFHSEERTEMHHIFLVSCVPSFNSLRPSDAYMAQQTRPSLAQIMACRLVGSKPLSEPMLLY